ncbi:MAG: hypothetical protein AB7I38_10970 [Dehalococcoidia bacterium]
MPWKLTSWGRTRMPLIGVPWRDLSDAEFAAAEERHPEIRERGYFEAEPAEEAGRPAARRARGGVVTATASDGPAPEPAPDAAPEVTDDSEEAVDD